MASKEESIETEIDTGIGEDGLPREELVSNPVEGDDDSGVEIVDDTPEEDRGATRLKDTSSLDEELEGVNEKVQERINKLRHAYHDERRRADEAERQQKAAIDYATAMKGQLSQTRSMSVEGTKQALQARLNEAVAKFTAAKERYSKAGEYQLSWEEMADLVEKMQESKFEALTLKRNIDAFEKMSLQQQNGVAQSHHPSGQQVLPDGANRQMPPVPAPDPALRDWMKKNSWFGNTDAGSNESAMTAVAYDTHEQLIKRGISPVLEPDRYYSAIDKRVREIFPNYDWPDKRGNQNRTAKSFSNVAKGGRSTTSSNGKVRLTRSQVEIAKKLGVPLQEYARQVQLLEGNK